MLLPLMNMMAKTIMAVGVDVPKVQKASQEDFPLGLTIKDLKKYISGCPEYDFENEELYQVFLDHNNGLSSMVTSIFPLNLKYNGSDILLSTEGGKMSVSILQAMKNAEQNLDSPVEVLRQLGLSQLHNSIVLLEKGYPDDTQMDIMAGYKKVEEVPEFDKRVGI